ncbi:hypothetical protein H6P81_005906 [Aristolochia fimbriata]|uniref:SH2 domain-containing protein n=1 Tax=Aristolochia fimbriata TaxID=158543 RepID=A0AAV7EZN6_ARIFI|nr:hypothetical protein H6P81_005906 [Aristolochia fimbriata]
MESQEIVSGGEDYLLLKDFRVDIHPEEPAFSLCFWIYLTSSTRPPVTIIRQLCSGDEGENPFIVLNEDKKLTLFPLLSLHEEASDPGNTDLLSTSPCAFPFDKWVHFGYEGAENIVHLYIDCEVVGEKHLVPNKDSYQANLQGVALVGNDSGDTGLQGYVHQVQLLPSSSLVKDHNAKDPPFVLSIDGSLISENHDVEEGRDGVWSVIGGKASCRRNFSLDVVLLDALGRTVDKEIELVASLVYADNGCPVEKPKDDSDAPLLISYDGVECPSTDRTVKLLHGRASFKLKISQLSSKCDGRLFRVRFEPAKGEKFPFLVAHSRPIHCISRNRTIRPSPASLKKPNTGANMPDGPQASGADDGSPEFRSSKGDGNPQLLSSNELRQSFSSKRFKLSHDKSSVRICISSSQHLEDGLHLNAQEDEKFDNFEGTDNTPSDSESVHARNSASQNAAGITNPVADLILFRYCLEGMPERSLLLREILNAAGDHDIVDFAEQVALYTGCTHNRNQIIIAKGLIQEGTETWNSIPRNTHEALWKNAAREIERRFMKISRCSNRSLSGQDMELLHGMAGSGDSISRDDFDRMWCWLYPVAVALSKDQINAIWECTSPQWIEGFVTKEEAEASLRDPEGVHIPGTFVLRFPTSRSWPHPDAGSLVVTYVGADYAVHHRLLSLRDGGNEGDMDQKPLQELLLAEPELTQLARVTRNQQVYCG